MSEAIRGRLGADFKLVEKAGKEPLLAFSVVEEKFAPPTVDENGKKVWAEPETQWHNDIVVRGDNPNRFKEMFRAGDPMILIGDYGQESTYTTQDGQERTQRTFFVDRFGPDASVTDVEVRRNPKAQTAAEQTQDVAKAVASEAQHVAPRDAVRQALAERLTSLVQANRLSETQRVSLVTAFDNAGTAAEAQVSVNTLALQMRLPEAETQWVTSVVDQYAGARQALSWSEAEALATQQTPPVHATPPQQVTTSAYSQ